MELDIQPHRYGVPSQEELAAIAAAIQIIIGSQTAKQTNPTPVWRFSGRWWS